MRAWAMVGVGAVLLGLGLGLWLWLARSKVEISPEEAREQIRQGKYDVIVDVRTPLPEPMRNLLTVLRKLESHERPSDSGRR